MKETFKSDLIDLRKFANQINATEIIKSIVSNPNVEKDPFYIVDLEDICNKHVNWITRMPRVEPHYAIKCNTDPMLLKLLAYLGAGFDCASKNEIQQVLDLGVSPHRIIFANPCKQASYIKYAYKMGVDTMTFDNEFELYKIKDYHPKARVVLRIITNDENAVCRFSMKFGADMVTSFKLIALALELGLDLIGISFHVGSGQMSPQAFSESIRNARQLFDYARDTFNHRMYFLDLGGGYPGASDSGDLFTDISKEINRSLDEHFPAELFATDDDDKKLRIIAEPGRYYACSAFTLCVSVIAKRVMAQSELQQQQDRENLMNTSCSSDGGAHFASQLQPYHASLLDQPDLLDASKSIMYYINDGVYASFNCLFYDHAECFPILVNDFKHSAAAAVGQQQQQPQEKLYKSSIWGPTCDGLDVVVKECYLPEMNTEEFMIFKNMGAYTLSGAVAFNGIPLAKPIYVASTSWDTIKNAFVDPVEDIMINNFTSSSSAASTCAVAANLAFTRALSTMQQQQEATGGIGGSNNGCEDCDSVISDDRGSGNDGSLCSDIADVNQLNDQLHDDLTLNCLDQSNVDCAIKC